MSKYQGSPQAVNEVLSSLVRDREVHKDLYTSQELFELETTRLFANT